MTTLSANASSFFDFARFRLGEEEFASLASLSGIWQAAFEDVLADRAEVSPLAEFFTLSRALVRKARDEAWQHAWLRAWYKGHEHGFSLSETLVFFHALLAACEARLLGEAASVGRIHRDLFSLLQGVVFAVLNALAELGDEAALTGAEVPGEVAALRALQAFAEKGEAVAVLSLGLSHRSHFGHLAANDQQNLQMQLAAHLRALLRPEDRMFAGRDSEWLLLLPGAHAMVQPTLACAHIQRSFANPLELSSGRSLPLEATIGAAVMPLHGDEPEQVFHAARLARWALQETREPFGWFRGELRDAWSEHLEIAEELRLALHHEMLSLFLQPQVDARSGGCASAELLLRWQRANGDWVPPPLMIQIIEENGWRHEFTDWLIRSALQLATDLQAVGLDIRLSLNLTADDLLDVDLPEMFSQRLATWQMPGNRFTLELTESALLANPQRSLETMRRLRELGLKLALDDFGTGYSSLSYLVSLPVNEIKIDRSFVVAMSTSDKHLRVVRSIIDLARDLDMMPLAEGVDDPAQLAALLAMGCHQIQGYLYARPMPFAEFVAWQQARLS